MKHFLPLGTVFVLVLTACGAASTPAPQATNASAHFRVASIKAIAAKRRREAAREAERLLRSFVPPPGASATDVPRGYGGVLRQTGPTPIGEVAQRSRLWSVHASLAVVAAFVDAHRPRGFRLDSRSSSSGSQTPANLEWSFTAGAQKRWLNVTVVRLPGRTIVRVDAQVVWVYPRSPNEKVPSAVREIVVHVRKVFVRATDPSKVALVDRWFDALPISPPGIALACPLVLGPNITFSFRGAGGRLLATAVAPPRPAWICSSIQFSIRGKPQTPLIDRNPRVRNSFIGRVQRLLGVRLVAGG